MHVSKRLSILTGAVLAAAGVATAGAPAAAADPVGPTLTASPISVFQIPALGIHLNGLAVPGPLIMSVDASSPETGKTTFSLAVDSEEMCSTTAAYTRVRIDYANLANGTRGSTSVEPCVGLGLPPGESTVATGSGPVVVTIAIVGEEGSPSAGQPSLPGIAGFIAP
ncbi:hypothetical protein ACIBF4_16450 [Rhodococcus coprophilus]|uniref:hypothetical protein n=1 Tax=Rhodococcus coprophilus TaxID=38310 RepID=UPI0037982533